LAKELGVSKNTASSRIRLLKKSGMITGSLILVDLTKFGYSRIIILSIKVVPSKMEQAIAYMKSIKGVDMCSEAIGSFNLVIWLFLKNIDEAQKIIAVIKKQPYVIKVQTGIWTHVEKALIRPKNISLDRIVGSNL
jgi:DNA-binding Lrp family transcriptional regulator